MNISVKPNKKHSLDILDNDIELNKNCYNTRKKRKIMEEENYEKKIKELENICKLNEVSILDTIKIKNKTEKSTINYKPPDYLTNTFTSKLLTFIIGFQFDFLKIFEQNFNSTENCFIDEYIRTTINQIITSIFTENICSDDKFTNHILNLLHKKLVNLDNIFEFNIFLIEQINKSKSGKNELKISDLVFNCKEQKYNKILEWLIIQGLETINLQNWNQIYTRWINNYKISTCVLTFILDEYSNKNIIENNKIDTEELIIRKQKFYGFFREFSNKLDTNYELFSSNIKKIINSVFEEVDTSTIMFLNMN